LNSKKLKAGGNGNPPGQIRFNDKKVSNGGLSQEKPGSAAAISALKKAVVDAVCLLGMLGQET
jgi:hypothetical protein